MTTRKEKVAEFDQGYNIIVTGRHVHVTEGMKQHAISKISKLERLGDRLIDIVVTMDIQKLDNRVDIIVKYGQTVIKSHASTTDMYVSIDKAVEKLQAQLSKYKEKLKEHHAKAHPVVDVPMKIYGIPLSELAEMSVVADIADEVEVNQAIEKVNHTLQEDIFKMHKIIKAETKPMKILSDDEAIMKMELSRDPVMVYRCESSRKLKVIWRMEDGNYGVISPE